MNQPPSKNNGDEKLKETPGIGEVPDFSYSGEYETLSIVKAALGCPALAKACADPFDYALRLRTGEVIAFEYAVFINSEWIHVVLKHRDEQPIQNRIYYPGERGVDIRLSDIVWVMDAPNGS